MAGERKVAFTESSAKRVAAATLGWERSGRDMPGIRFRQVGGDDGEIRLGRVGQTWNKGATATVTQLDKNGNPLDPTVTFDAKNWFENVYVDSGQYVKVACGQANGEWILIEYEMAGCTPPAYKATILSESASDSSDATQISEGDGPQALVNNGGCVKWLKLSEVTLVTDVRLDASGLTVCKQQFYVFKKSGDSEACQSLPTEDCNN